LSLFPRVAGGDCNVIYIMYDAYRYSFGGYILYKDQGWTAFQVGKGGSRFVALQTLSWITYALSLFLSLVNVFVLSDYTVDVAGFSFGVMSYGLTISSLLVFQSPTYARQQVSAASDAELKNRTFNEDIQLNTSLLHSGEGVTDLWWVFIALNFAISTLGSWVGWRSDYQTSRLDLKILSTVVVLWSAAFATTVNFFYTIFSFL